MFNQADYTPAQLKRYAQSENVACPECNRRTITEEYRLRVHERGASLMVQIRCAEGHRALRAVAL